MANQQNTPRVTMEDALDAVDRIRRAGASESHILGWLCEMDPALVVQAVEEIQASSIIIRTEET